MHQAAEYLIAAAFVASGLQSPEPMVPTLLGGLIMINTGCSKGPLAAFSVFGRRIHRILDAVLVVLVLVAAGQPVLEIDSGTRLIMALLAVCMGMIWLQSDFSEHAERPRRMARSAPSTTAAEGGAAVPPVAHTVRPGASRVTPPVPDGSTADTIGRTAGRLAGKGVKIYRSRKAAQPKAKG